jgi:hypothetical protein
MSIESVRSKIITQFRAQGVDWVMQSKSTESPKPTNFVLIGIDW